MTRLLLYTLIVFACTTLASITTTTLNPNLSDHEDSESVIIAPLPPGGESRFRLIGQNFLEPTHTVEPGLLIEPINADGPNFVFEPINVVIPPFPVFHQNQAPAPQRLQWRWGPHRPLPTVLAAIVFLVIVLIIIILKTMQILS
jgi:hypothetical protein